MEATQVYSFAWWMGHYGANTPKRHKGYTNNINASRLDLGIYHRSQQAKRVETVRKYKKKDGSMGYVGTKHLKSTQPGPHLIFICDSDSRTSYFHSECYFTYIYIVGHAYM